MTKITGSMRRRDILRAGAAIGAGIGLGSLAPFAAAQNLVPDTILHNAKIYTVDARDAVTEAVAIKDGRILATGESRKLLDLAQPGTRKIDLGGRAVTPGFIDAHPHMDGAGWDLVRPQWGKLESIDDILGNLKTLVEKLAPGAWLVMPCLAGLPDYYRLPDALREKRWPDRHDLDKVSPNNPVYIEPHFLAVPGVGIANTAALRTGQLPKDFSARALEVVRDSDGEPTGVFIDYNYPRMIPLHSWPIRIPAFPQIPRQTDAGLEASIRAGMKAFNKAGLTTIYEGHGLSKPVMDFYQRLHGNRELTIRTYGPHAFPFFAYDNDELADKTIELAVATGGGDGAGDDLFRIGGVAYSFDSAAGASAALMREPYRGPQGQSWKGIQLTSDDKLRKAITKAAARGLRIQVQCSGEAAVDKVLHIFEDLDGKNSIRDKRWTIEHCQMANQEHVEKCRRLGVVVTSAITFLWDYGSTYLKSFGPEISDRALPYRSWIDGGVVLANSSDSHPYEPIFGFWEMLARKDGLSGREMGPAQKLTRAQALRANTASGAYVAFWEKNVGSIEPGKYADLVILSDDIMTVAEDRITDTKVLATVLGGKPVHDTGIF
jgi:predicted amidohydrolase YtcJ